MAVSTESTSHEPISDEWRRLLRRRQAAARRRAQLRNKEFDLRQGFAESLFVAQGGRCAVTGLKFSFEAYPDAFVKHPFAPSIDRKLSGRGYTEDNVRLVCTAANFGMGQWGDELFIRLADAAAQRARRDQTDPDPAADADWHDRQQTRIQAVEAVRDKLPATEQARLQAHLASLRRALTMGPERLRAAAAKASGTRRTKRAARCKAANSPRKTSPRASCSSPLTPPPL